MTYDEALEISNKIAFEMTRIFHEKGYEVSIEGKCELTGAVGCYMLSTEEVTEELFLQVMKESASRCDLPLPDAVYKQYF